MTNAYPSRNQSYDDTLTGVLLLFREKLLQEIDNMTPAIVIAYDRNKNRANVQPLIQIVDTNNKVYKMAQIASVPVLQLGGGGFVISAPIKAGDKGWLKSCDSDISLFLQDYNFTAPNTGRKHSFSDSVFIPDSFMNNVTIANEDKDNLVIQNNNGSVKISWWQNLLKIIAPSVGIGGTPNNSAILDLQSSTKGFLPPRMSQAQINSINSPVAGMIVWNLTTSKLSIYDGSTWNDVMFSPK